MDNCIIPDSDEEFFEVDPSEPSILENDLSFTTQATMGSPPNKKLRLQITSSLNEDDLPPEILKAAQDARNNSMPGKSVNKYNLVYDNFMKWAHENNIQHVSETVLLAYFGNLQKKYKPSTLWSTYSMLKSTLTTYHNIKIYEYAQLVNFLKQNGKRHEKKKAKELTEAQCRQFLQFAPDNVFLPLKVSLLNNNYEII